MGEAKEWVHNNVVIASGGQQRDSAIHIRVSTLPQTPLPSRLPHDTEQSSLSFTVGPCWISVLNTAGPSRRWCRHPLRASFRLRHKDSSLRALLGKAKAPLALVWHCARSRVFKPALTQIAFSHCAWYLVIPTT